MDEHDQPHLENRPREVALRLVAALMIAAGAFLPIARSGSETFDAFHDAHEVISGGFLLGFAAALAISAAARAYWMASPLVAILAFLIITLFLSIQNEHPGAVLQPTGWIALFGGLLLAIIQSIRSIRELLRGGGNGA